MRNLYIYFSFSLIFAVIISLSLGYYIGKKSSEKSDTNLADSIKSQNVISITPTTTLIPTPYVIKTVNNNSQQAPIDNKVCPKYGFAQKWEYLTSYTIKEGDSLTSIAKLELKDEARVNEILKINGANPLIIGSTLYLPPPSVTKSSGNLKQIYGKLIGKDSSYWKLLLSSDVNGQSILIPSFLVEKVSNKNSIKVGDCIKVFLDDGYEVYAITLL